jgi:hypothetical protein
MIEDQTQDIPHISNEENNILTADYSVEEVHEAIAQMEHNKALGSDGFHSGVLSTKIDLMALFACF